MHITSQAVARRCDEAPRSIAHGQQQGRGRDLGELRLFLHAVTLRPPPEYRRVQKRVVVMRHADTIPPLLNPVQNFATTPSSSYKTSCSLWYTIITMISTFTPPTLKEKIFNVKVSTVEITSFFSFSAGTFTSTQRAFLFLS